MPSPSRRGAAWLLLAVYGLSLAVAWVLASPVGASPDEPAHIAYAWGTATGQTGFDEQLVTIAGGRIATRIQVPAKLLQYPDPGCYAYHPETPVNQCSPKPADNLRESAWASYMSGYPPLFYVVEGAVLRAATAADLSGPTVLYGARLAAAILSALAVALGVYLLSLRFPAHIVLLATLLALPATAWFLAASVNPNGLEIAAAFLLAAGVLSMRVDLAVGVRSKAAVLAIPLGTLLLAWTRPLSWVWAALILGMLLIPTPRQDGESWRERLPLRRLGAAATATTILVLGSSMAWFGYALQLRAVSSEATGNSTHWGTINPLGRVVMLLLHSGTLVTEQVGTFGWLDTPLPTMLVLFWVSMAGVATAAWFSGRNIFVPRWSVGVVLGLGYLAALLDEYRGAWGWQGRYLLPITAAVCVLAIPGIMSGLEQWIASGRLVPWILVTMMGVNALSVPWFLFRNLSGMKGAPARLPSIPGVNANPAWNPPLGRGFVLALVALAFACGVVAVWTLRPVPAKAEPLRSPTAAPEEIDDSRAIDSAIFPVAGSASPPGDAAT